MNRSSLTRIVLPGDQVPLPGHPAYYIDPRANVYRILDNKVYLVYRRLYLTNNGEYKHTIIIDKKLYYLHRLFAEAFIPNPNNLYSVRPKDGNFLNITLDNLYWYSGAATAVYYTNKEISNAYDMVYMNIGKSDDYISSKCDIVDHFVIHIRMAISHMIDNNIMVSSEAFLSGFKQLIYGGKEIYDLKVNRFGLIYRPRLDKYMIGGKSSGNGYICSGVYLNKRASNIFHHRAVAETFIPNPDHKEQVNHINGIKMDPCVWNLEWVTGAENIRHAYRNGLIKYGEKSSRSLYSKKQIENVCNLINSGKYSNQAISEMTNIPRSTVYNIQTGSSWFEVSKNYDMKYFRYDINGKCLGEDVDRSKKVNTKIREYVTKYME